MPGFGAAGGFAVRLLDKTNSDDYKRLGEVTETFMSGAREKAGIDQPFHLF